jgi:hypothetical protein
VNEWGCHAHGSLLYVRVGFGGGAGEGRTPCGISHCFFPSLKTRTSSGATRSCLLLVPIERRSPSVIKALRYGNCSIALSERGTDGSGIASFSSALSLASFSGFESRWNVKTFLLVSAALQQYRRKY